MLPRFAQTNLGFYINSRSLTTHNVSLNHPPCLVTSFHSASTICPDHSHGIHVFYLLSLTRMAVTTQNMHVGLICPCPMGNNLTRLLWKHGHECHVFNCASIDEEHDQQRDGHQSIDSSLEAFLQQLPKPRIVWIMVPTSGQFSALTDHLLRLLEPGDIVIDNKNSYCQASEYCAETLKQRGIRYVDVGTSTAASSVKRGYCLMIGGDPEVVQYLEPIFLALAPVPKNKAVAAKSNLSNVKRKRKVKPTVSHLYCGEAGAGHFARQFYEGAEQSLMRAYAEVLAERDRHSANLPMASLPARP